MKAYHNLNTYSGIQLRDMRERTGLTQIDVALALGLAEGSSACVCDWKKEREAVPPQASR